MTSNQMVKHERRYVGPAGGWQEPLDTCVCGQKWPCTGGQPTSKKLLRCPFCGYEAALHIDDFDRWRQVVCGGCGAKAPEQMTEGAAYAAWNRRPAHEPPAEQFSGSIYEASIVGLRNLLVLALSHVDFDALKVSHQKDHDTLVPFASVPANQPFVRPFTPDEANAYRAFMQDYFEPASSQPPGVRPEIVAAAGRVSHQVTLHDEDDQFSTDLRMLVAHVAGECDKCPKERARGCNHCCWCGTAPTKPDAPAVETPPCIWRVGCQRPALCKDRGHCMGNEGAAPGEHDGR